MIKQLTTKTVIQIDDHIITLEQIKNTPSGNPRYKASITNIKNFTPHSEEGKQYNSCCAFVYTFTGHYCGEYGEAEYILTHHKEKYNIK